jgi:hypothetical protein
MCKILERDGREWAVETIRQLAELVGKGDGNRELIVCLERGLTGRPPGFVVGVQSVIDEVRDAGKAA